MIWIGLIALFSLLIAIVILKGVSVGISKFRPLDCDGSVLDLLMDYPKTVIVFVLVVICYGESIASYQIKEMYNCSVRSSVQKVDTQYSWYFDSCQFKNKQGVWIDFKQVRGTPDGEDSQ